MLEIYLEAGKRVGCLTRETTQYLSSFKEFLVAQQLKTNDPAIRELLEEVNRELLKQTERGPVC